MELRRLPLRIQRGTDVERVEEGGGEDEQRRFRKVTAGADPVRSLGEYRARAGVGRLRTCGQNQIPHPKGRPCSCQGSPERRGTARE